VITVDVGRRTEHNGEERVNSVKAVCEKADAAGHKTVRKIDRELCSSVHVSIYRTILNTW